MEEAIRQRAEELDALQGIVLDITAQYDLPKLLQIIVERAVRLLMAHAGGLYLCYPDRGEVRCVVSYNTPGDYTGTILKYGEGSAGIVAQTGKPLIIDDYRTWSGRAAVYEEKQPFTAVLSVPMKWQGRVTGVIHVLEDVESRRFTHNDLELLTLFASHAAIAVENTRLREQLQHRTEELEQQLAERKRAVEAMKESEERYRSLINDVIDTSVIGIFILDKEFKVVWVNQALERFFGLQREEVIGRDKRRLISERIKYVFDDPEGFERRVLATYDNNTYIENFECHVLHNGEREDRWLEHWSQPIRSGLYEGGRIEHYSDITERKQAEEKIRASLKEKEILLREIHHRVKNNLQIISSLLDLSSGKTDDKKTIDLLTEVRNKIYTIALIHTQLYQSDRFDEIDMGKFIGDLVSHLSQIYISEGRVITPVIQSEDVHLPIDRAIPSGLALNELVTNAFRHGFTGRDRGTIEISLKRMDGDNIFLMVKDDGIGIPDDVDVFSTDSLGLKLTRNLIQGQLKGKIAIKQAKGTEISMKFRIFEKGSE